MPETSEELVQKLVEKFRSLLDEALVVAIACDHDLTEPSQYKSAQTVLEDLAQHVTTEEASGFNPSGISNIPEDVIGDDSTIETSSQQASHAHDTDTTSASDQTTSTASTSYSIPRLTSFDDDSEDNKVLLLQGMFSELKAFDIKHSLKKANGDVQTALDDLLNIQYLKSTGQEQKGIDGFFEPEEDVGKKKKKGNKKKGKKALGSETPSSSSGATSPSPDEMKELKRQDEIAYLADRLDLPFEVVSEIYRNKRCSSGAAAVEILHRYMSQGIETHDRDGKKYARELAQKYQNVPEKFMSTIVQVTGSISQESDDIAALVSRYFVKNPWTQKLEVSYQLTPLPEEDIEGFETVTRGKSKLARPVSGSTILTPGSSEYAQAAERASQHNQAKRQAVASAASLNRRGASNPLYRQAAGYYSERAREQARYEMHATSTAADLLVDKQSTSTSIDLHGVYVQDGVRIARQRVQAWWAGLGEFRSDKARQQPFTVITGLGRHSAGGVSQLRQAVAAALLQDGWKMQVETGRFLVKVMITNCIYFAPALANKRSEVVQMAAKSQSAQASYGPRDDPSAALLSPSERDNTRDENSGVFRLTFSPILLLRLMIVPVIITDVVFICMPVCSPGSAAAFAIGGILLVFWHASRVFRSILPGRRSNKFDLKIGNFFCTIGTTSLVASRASRGTWSYLVSAVDFSFGLVFIGPTFLSFRTYNWDHDAEVSGLSLTTVIMQSIIAVLNLISLFRKMKIVVYKGEDDEEDHLYSISDLDVFRDEVSEPRDSMASEV
ncbi:hypothetical protein FBEOM_9714 [Fusarium beomiforme]|uniref:Smr domain-containing protein n=1 Tax=Fusarium beomiforme TaxID=44412 RepID=A0A9P5AD52_9HYPO|nr:hypothetical protein FBEOM_9714 [Fusarium beomiforme]